LKIEYKVPNNFVYVSQKKYLLESEIKFLRVFKCLQYWIFTQFFMERFSYIDLGNSKTKNHRYFKCTKNVYWLVFYIWHNFKYILTHFELLTDIFNFFSVNVDKIIAFLLYYYCILYYLYVFQISNFNI